MESRIMSPASLVLPHLLPHQPCLDLLPLCPIKAPLPRRLHPSWKRPKQQHWSMKLSLKIENDIFEPLALFQPDQHPHPGGGMSRCPVFPVKRLQSLPFLLQSFAVFPYGNDSVLRLPMFKWLEKIFFSAEPDWFIHAGAQSFLFIPPIQPTLFFTNGGFNWGRGCQVDPALLHSLPIGS